MAMSRGIVLFGLVAILACMCFVQADDKVADDDIKDAAHTIHAFRRAGPKDDSNHDDHAHDHDHHNHDDHEDDHAHDHDDHDHAHDHEHEQEEEHEHNQGHDDDHEDEQQHENGQEQEQAAESLKVVQNEEVSIEPSEYFSSFLNREDEALLTTSDNILGH